ncbi:MAG: hypothetical protein OXH78_02890 [Acidimicrobiaceae bacterium]|nr:hypothetical protein [Acidimicrobiaceae bacterium]
MSDDDLTDEQTQRVFELMMATGTAVAAAFGGKLVSAVPDPDSGGVTAVVADASGVEYTATAFVVDGDEVPPQATAWMN